MLRAGMQVECIFQFQFRKFEDEILPEKGEIYTIGEIVVLPEGTGLRLVEIVNPPHNYCYGRSECCFASTAFSPVVSTDISIFKPMLTDEHIGERV